MLSNIAISFQGLEGAEKDKEILRIAIMAEMDSVEFYKQLAFEVDSAEIKKIISSIAREEEDHLNKFKNLFPGKDKKNEIKKFMKK